MIQHQLQLRFDRASPGLSSFDHPRLPLWAPVLYKGLRCRISGRTFGRLEYYDLQIKLEGHIHHFHELTRDQFSVDFETLRREESYDA